jgi:hypothetical protein
LLGSREQLVFDRLGVFAGPFHAAAACAVVADDGVESLDVVDALGDLVAKSMVVAEATPVGATSYQLLETLRQYAIEQLESRSETETYRRKLARYYAEFCEQYGPELSQRGEIEARRAVLAEIDNVRAAVTWSLDAEDDADAAFALRIIAAIALFVTTARSSGLGGWAERACERLDVVDQGRQFSVLGAATFSAQNRSDYATALLLAERAHAMGVPPDCPVPVLALGGRAVAYSADDWMGSIELLREGAGILRAMGDTYGELTLEVIIAIYCSVTRLFEEARRTMDDLLPRVRSLGNPTVLVIALYAVGMAYVDEDPKRALDALEESLVLTRAGASDIVFGNVHEVLLRLRMQAGDARGALVAMRASLVQSEAVGNHPAIASTLYYGLDAVLACGERETAAIMIGITDISGIFVINQSGADIADHAAASAAVRQAIGEARWTELTARGAAMSNEEVVPFALGVLDDLIETVTTA